MDMSLDGYVSGPDGDSSWQDVNNGGNWEDLFKAMKDIDLFVLGAGMWPEYSEHWKNVLKADNPPANELKFAQLAEKTQHIVFSSKLNDAGWENTTINHGELKTEIEKLKAMEGKDIMSFGGASFARSLLEAGLIDTYLLRINPVILAGGKSIFKDLEKRHNLKLVEIKQYDQLVGLTYVRA